MADLPIIGDQKQIQITIAMLCTFCFPKAVPGIMIHKGESICADCFKAIKEKEKVVADAT